VQDTLQEIKEFEGDLGHVQETICRRSENTKRYRHAQETMCTRYQGTIRRERTYCKLEARTTEQGTLMCDGICARDNVQENREHKGEIYLCKRHGQDIREQLEI